MTDILRQPQTFLIRCFFVLLLFSPTFPLLAQHKGSISAGTNTTDYWVSQSLRGIYYYPKTSWFVRGDYGFQLQNDSRWQIVTGMQYTEELTFAGYNPSTCLRGEGCFNFDTTFTKRLTWVGIPIQVNRSLSKLPLSIYGGLQPEIKLTNIGTHTNNARLWNMHLFMGAEVSFLQNFFLRGTAQVGLRSISNRGHEIIHPDEVFYIIPGRLQFGLGYTFAKREE